MKRDAKSSGVLRSSKYFIILPVSGIILILWLLKIYLTNTSSLAFPQTASSTPTPISSASVKDTDIPIEKTYENKKYRFAFDVKPGERIIVCENNYPNNKDNAAIWIYPFEDKTDTRTVLSVNGPYCGTEGSFHSITVRIIPTPDPKFSPTPTYKSESDYTVNEIPIRIDGVEGVHIVGKRNVAIPAPLPESIDYVSITNNGVKYSIDCTFLERNFRFLK